MRLVQKLWEALIGSTNYIMAAKKKVEEKSQLPPKIKSFGVFDIVFNINEGIRGENLMKDCSADQSENAKTEIEKLYNSFLINRNFSNFSDTILLANVLNSYPGLPHKMQYEFLRNTIRPKKRFAKWGKASDNSGDVAVLMELYNYSAEKARAALPCLTEDQMIVLRKRVDKGGKQ